MPDKTTADASTPLAGNRDPGETLPLIEAVAMEKARPCGELERQKRHVEAIIRNLEDGLIVLDGRRRIELLNPAAERMLGLTEAEVAGWSPADGAPDPRFEALIQICQPVLPGERLWHPALLDAERPGHVEVTVQAPERRVLKVFSSPILSPDDGPSGEVIVLHDVTREREFDQMRNDFVSTVSHELRTPLFSIKGFVELILRGKVPDPAVQREFLERVLDQANHLSAIVSDLLDVSRLEAGRMDFARSNVDLADIVRDALARLETVARSRDISLEMQAPPRLPQVSGDPRRLEQVVTNLVSNAIKFSRPGDTVSVHCQASEREVIVQVVDHGIGIPAEAIPRLFTKFYQVDASATRKAGGTGLGLFISRRIVEAHGGRIGVQSEPDHGSTFYFSIPIVAVKEG